MRLVLLALATTALIGTAVAQPTLQNHPVLAHATPPAVGTIGHAAAPSAGAPAATSLAPPPPGQVGCPGPGGGLLADKGGNENPHENGPPHGTNSQAMISGASGGHPPVIGPGGHPIAQGAPDHENPQPHDNGPIGGGPQNSHVLAGQAGPGEGGGGGAGGGQNPPGGGHVNALTVQCPSAPVTNAIVSPR